HQFVLRVPTEGAGENGKEASSERDKLRQYLEDNGIMTLIHYPIPPHMAQAYEYLGVPAGSLPITERFASEVISLPMYTGLTRDEQDRVIACVNSFK
ncbi:MAG: DegT/DnrJ/EryC1/StrS family aminotransferase, partial [Butyrivibrio sp.]|nr:DegT/DnrJ/EryC1/StrS family aminotransferase [Butyrivibrio sp.]